MDPITQETISREIALARQVYGDGNVVWPENMAWVLIRDFPLPSGYTKPRTDILVVMPPYYGVTKNPIEEFYLRNDLRVKRGNTLRAIPHYHRILHRTQYCCKGWAWYCLHARPSSWRDSDNILVFLKLVELLLQDPFKERLDQ